MAEKLTPETIMWEATETYVQIQYKKTIAPLSLYLLKGALYRATPNGARDKRLAKMGAQLVGTYNAKAKPWVIAEDIATALQEQRRACVAA